MAIVFILRFFILLEAGDKLPPSSSYIFTSILSQLNQKHIYLSLFNENSSGNLLLATVCQLDYNNRGHILISFYLQYVPGNLRKE